MSRTPSLLALAASALLVAPASAQTEPGSFEYRVPLKGLVVSGEASPETPAPAPVALLLRSATLESATVGQPYSFDFKSLLDLSGGNPTPPMSAVSWGASASLPSWLTLNPDTGVLSGTPTVKNEAGTDFEVIATHEDAEGRQVFTIVVNGVILRATQISAGGYHTCAITPSGGVKCWGRNAEGQLGDNSTTQRLTPVDVAGLTAGVLNVTAGVYHTCAVTTAGGAKCWGANNNGQLGDNTTAPRLTPVTVSGLTSGVLRISAGADHTCAVTTAGGAKCWGANGDGQLGDNSTAQRLIPVDVSGLSSGTASISTGSAHTCVTTTTGGAKCWGANYHGMVGDNSTVQRLIPVDVSGLSSGVADVTAGHQHTCAVTTAGRAKCWGRNHVGQLGDNSYLQRLTPVDVSGLLSGVSAIFASHQFTCALTGAGAVKCWGWNGYGQLGDDSTVTRMTPADVSGLAAGVVRIEPGRYHTCAITSSGGAKCWGFNQEGQVGDHSTADRGTPVAVQL